MVWRHGLDDYLGLVVHRVLEIAFQTFKQKLNKNPIYSSVSNKVFNQNEYTAYRQFRFGITYNFGKQFNIERSKSNQEQSGGKG